MKFVLSALLLHLLTTVAIACTCGPSPSPYKAYQEAQAVFTGKVVSSQDIPYDQTVSDPKYNVYDRHFKFAVTEVLKGTKTNEIVINVGRRDSSCYQGFTIGESYLVYAYASNQRFNRSESYWGAATKKPDETMFAGACTRTETLKYAFDDLLYLRGMLQGVAEPVLYGSVSRVDNDPKDPESSRVTYLSGFTVIAESNGRKFSAITDNNGLYSFKKLPNGEYKVRAVLPGKYMHYWFNEEKVTVPSDGYGAFAEFSTGWNNHVEGKVSDDAGNVVRRAVVRLLSVDPPVDKMSPQFGTISDYLGDAGKYQIYGKTPGRYLLAVEVYAPFLSGRDILRTYYPQTSNRQNASIITLGEADKLQVDLKLTTDQRVRWIKGVVVWSDGTPMSKNAWVALEKLEDSEDKNNVRYDLTHADEQGNFQLQVFENAQYWVKGEVGTLGVQFKGLPQSLWDQGIQEIRSKPIKIIGSQSPVTLKIVIPLPEGATAPEP